MEFLITKIIVVILAALLSSERGTFGQLVDFDELQLSDNSYFDGYRSGASLGTWSSGGMSFNTNQYGPGWSYSNVDDTITPGFSNQWAAATGSDFGGSGNYIMANSLEPFGAFIDLPELARIQSLEITNSTYATISIKEGDGFAKKFGGTSGNDADYFKVTFSGFSGLATSGAETGFFDFYLSDYRFSDNALDYIIEDWQTVDLASLGNARSIGITFESTDIGNFGMNTPAYVAIDNVSLNAIPEPASFLIVTILLVAFVARRRSKLASAVQIVR